MMIAIDIEMPKSCLSCPLENNFNECSVYNDTFSKADPKYCTYEYLEHRPDWCPLMQVNKLAVENIVQRSDVELYGEDVIKTYISRDVSSEIGNKITDSTMCQWETKHIEEWYPFANKVRATVYVVDKEGNNGSTKCDWR